ncbi:MAG: hypothetical protein J0H74_31775 [Chitinophagaceae bacterium]|nr:hypothetical protein [Chitinophagaceae bacterium]
MNFFPGEEETFYAVGVSNTDLDMAFFEYTGSCEDGAAFCEDAAGGVEDFAIGEAFCLSFGLRFIQDTGMHIFNYSAVQFT